MRAFHHPDQSRHDPRFFLMRGAVRPNYEVPARAASLLAGLDELGMAAERALAAAVLRALLARLRVGFGVARRGLLRFEGPAQALVALELLAALLGAADDPSGFDPRHPVLVEAWKRFRHHRIGRTGLLLEALVPAVLEQKVTGQEAFAGFRRLVHRYGERAPGPGEGLRLWVQPTAAALRSVPSWEWLRMHIDPARSRTVLRVAQVADTLERLATVAPVEADRRLRTLPGVGEWTSAEVRARALGDPDAVSFGDYHIAKNVTYALTGEVGDDERMAELLEPWVGHRHRVQRLVVGAGAGRLGVGGLVRAHPGHGRALQEDGGGEGVGG